VLSHDEAAHVRVNFSIYDHEWAFPACYLGEPFLVGNCLAYYDGRAVNLAAFPVDEPGRQLSVGQVCAALDELPLWRTPDLLHIWGQFEASAEIMVRGHRLRLSSDDSARRYGGAFSLDIEGHDLVGLPEARKAIRAAANKGLSATVRRAEYFTADHFRLIEEWVRTRPIGLPSVSAATGLPAYVRNGHVELLEILRDGNCCGFGVLAMPTSTDAVLVASFSERYPGARIEDRLMAEAIELCRTRGLRRLHLGYTGTASLARFKRKWGARQSGPDYADVVYCRNENDVQFVRSLSFFWTSRIHCISANDRR